MKLILIIMASVISTITLANSNTIVEQQIQDRQKISELKHELELLTLKKDIAMMQKECRENNGCGSAVNVISDTNTSDPNDGDNINTRSANLRDTISALQLVAIVNNTALFEHSPNKYAIGDTLGSNIILTSVDDTFITISYVHNNVTVKKRIYLDFNLEEDSDNVE